MVSYLRDVDSGPLDFCKLFGLGVVINTNSNDVDSLGHINVTF